MPHSYQFRLEIIKLATEQDFGIHKVAKLHQIHHAIAISWLKDLSLGGESLKSSCAPFPPPKSVKPKMKKKAIEVSEPTYPSPQAFKKLQRELALTQAEIAYLKNGVEINESIVCSFDVT